MADDITTTNNAEAFVKNELDAAKKSLRALQITGTIIVLGLGIYVIVITSGFFNAFQPVEAAKLTEGFITGQIDDHRAAFVEEVRTRVPAMIQEAPNYAIQQLPGYREAIETRFEDQLNHTLKGTSDKLSGNLSQYLTDNKEKIKALLESSKDPKALAAVGPSLRQVVLDYFKEKPADGSKSIDEQLTDSYSLFHDAEQRLSRLATAKDLTPAEMKSRRAVAIIANTIDNAGIQPLTLPKLGTADGDSGQ